MLPTLKVLNETGAALEEEGSSSLGDYVVTYLDGIKAAGWVLRWNSDMIIIIIYLQEVCLWRSSVLSSINIYYHI